MKSRLRRHKCRYTTQQGRLAMSVIKASLYRNVLSWRLKVTLEWTQRSGGSGTTVGVCSMHQKGPAAANYRSPNDDIVHDNNCTGCSRSETISGSCTSWSSPPGRMVQRSTNIYSWYSTRCLTGSQWRSRSREVCNEPEPTRHTAVLRTDCSHWMSQAGRPAKATLQ